MCTVLFMKYPIQCDIFEYEISFEEIIKKKKNLCWDTKITAVLSHLKIEKGIQFKQQTKPLTRKVNKVVSRLAFQLQETFRVQ